MITKIRGAHRLFSWSRSTLIVVALSFPGVALAQGSASVQPTRLIATTVDPVPGFPNWVRFAGHGSVPAFGPATLARGWRVAFYGNYDPDLVSGTVFYRGPSGLVHFAPSYLDPFLQGVPFSTETLDVVDTPIADEASLAFTGILSEWLCDGTGGCSGGVGTDAGIFVSQNGEMPDVEVAQATVPPYPTPVLLGIDQGSLIYDDGTGRIFVDGQMLLDYDNVIDGYEIAGGGNCCGYRSGIGFAFANIGVSAGVPTEGVWAQILGSWSTLATLETEMPGMPGVNFEYFGRPVVGSTTAGTGSPPSTAVVFWGGVGFDLEGIYSGPGALVKVADTNDTVLVDGSPEDIYEINPEIAVDGLEVAFMVNNQRHLIVADAVTGLQRRVLSEGDVLRFGHTDYAVWGRPVLHRDGFSDGNIVLTGRLGEPGNPLGPQFDAVFLVDANGDGLSGPGSSQADPIAPTRVETDPDTGLPLFVFEDSPSVSWIDPPLASGFTYRMRGSSLFTAVLDLPSGFNAPFEIVVGEQSLGTFAPGSVIDFGPGVGSFTIQGIDPAVDAENHAPFAVQLEFDTLYASFDATPIPVPEPSPPSAIVAGLIGLFGLARRRARSNRLWRSDPASTPRGWVHRSSSS